MVGEFDPKFVKAVRGMNAKVERLPHSEQALIFEQTQAYLERTFNVDFLRAADIAQFFGVTPAHVRGWMRDGCAGHYLCAIKIGREFVTTKVAVMNFLRELNGPQLPQPEDREQGKMPFDNDPTGPAGRLVEPADDDGSWTDDPDSPDLTFEPGRSILATGPDGKVKVTGPSPLV